MSDNVLLAIEPTAVQMLAGDAPIAISVHVTNTAVIIDRIDFALSQASDDWYSFEPASIRIDPGASGTSTLLLSPPRRPDVVAGVYDLAVQAISFESPGEPSVAELRLEILPSGQFELLMPKSKAIGRSGTVAAELINDVDATLTVNVEGYDLMSKLSIEPASTSLVIHPGSRLEVPFKVRPKRRPLTGKPETYRALIRATPDVDPSSPIATPREREAEFEYRPPLGEGPWRKLPEWGKMLLQTAVPLVIALLLLSMCGPYENLRLNPPSPSRTHGVPGPIEGQVQGEPPKIDRLEISSAGNGIDVSWKVSGAVDRIYVNEEPICGSRDECRSRQEGSVVIRPDRFVLLVAENGLGTVTQLEVVR